MNDAIEVISASLGVLIIFIGFASPVLIICFFHYLKKKLEHKQIMAAIEKGIPFTQIKPPEQTGPAWVKNIAAGISLPVIAAALIGIVFLCRGPFDEAKEMLGYFIIAAVIFAIGISRLVRGLLQRKIETQSQSLNSKQTAEKV